MSGIDDLKREKLEGERFDSDCALPAEDALGNPIRRCVCERHMVTCDCGALVCWPCEMNSGAGVECACGERFCHECTEKPRRDSRTDTLVCGSCSET